MNQPERLFFSVSSERTRRGKGRFFSLSLCEAGAKLGLDPLAIVAGVGEIAAAGAKQGSLTPKKKKRRREEEEDASVRGREGKGGKKKKEGRRDGGGMLPGQVRSLAATPHSLTHSLEQIKAIASGLRLLLSILHRFKYADICLFLCSRSSRDSEEEKLRKTQQLNNEPTIVVTKETASRGINERNE